MVTKYNTMIRDGQKNTSAKVRKIEPSDRNYIPGCLDLQWWTTSDAWVYLLVQ